MKLLAAADGARKRTPLAPRVDTLTYTLNNAAAISGLSRSTLYRYGAAGRLRMPRVGGRRLVDAASLHALLGVAE